MAKKTNNSLQNTTQKTKDRASRTPLKTWVELWCSKSESSSCTSWHVASVMLLLFCSKTGDSFFVFLEKPLHAVCLVWVKEQASEKGSRVGTHRNVDFLLKNTKQSAYDIHKDSGLTCTIETKHSCLWKLSYHFFCYNYLKFHLHGEEAPLLRNQVSHLLNIFYVNKISEFLLVLWNWYLRIERTYMYIKFIPLTHCNIFFMYKKQ